VRLEEAAAAAEAQSEVKETVAASTADSEEAVRATLCVNKQAPTPESSGQHSNVAPHLGMPRQEAYY